MGEPSAGYKHAKRRCRDTAEVLSVMPVCNKRLGACEAQAGWRKGSHCKEPLPWDGESPELVHPPSLGSLGLG